MPDSRRDPICGMQGVIEHRGRWFCSEQCVAEFDRSGPRRRTWIRWVLDPWVWVPLSGIMLAMAGRWLPMVYGISAMYAGYLQRVGIPVLLGLVLGGVIDHFVPRTYIVKLLSGPRKRVVARSTLLGFLASSCSHGCLALSLELYRKGASIPAVVSFLLASPWASMSLTFLLLSLFGVKGFMLIAGALVIALITGLVFQRLDRSGLIESNPHTKTVPDDLAIWQDVKMRWRTYSWTGRQLLADGRGVVAGMVPLGRMMLGWVQLGLVLSAVAGASIPHGAFERWLGPSPVGLMLTLLMATVIEVCSEGTAPLAFELYRQTGALGNAFTFLMAGVVTDYTELGALWTTIGKRTVLWLLVVTLPLVISFGLVLNLLR